jgi:hypothetical protein
MRRPDSGRVEAVMAIWPATLCGRQSAFFDEMELRVSPSPVAKTVVVLMSDLAHAVRIRR